MALEKAVEGVARDRRARDTASWLAGAGGGAGAGPLGEHLWVVARSAWDLVSLGYFCGHLLGRWPWHSVDQHLLGHALVRCSVQDRESLVRASQRAREAFTRRALEGPGVLPAAARAPLLRAGFWCVDHGRSLLLTVILGYQLIDWWYNSAEAALAPQKRPVPPPPPVAPPAPDGVPLPEDPKLCPLCREPFRNESVLAVSGYGEYMRPQRGRARD